MAINNNPVLYIDDDEVNLLLFEATFSRYYNIYTANSTAEAEAIMENTQFKVVVSDINMPNETGLEFIKRYETKGYEPVFILLSAYINNELLLSALNQGRIFRYLTKPLVNDDVKFTIDQAINIYDLRTKNQELYIQTLESQQNFYNIFQASQDGIVIFDKNNLILEANAAFLLNFNSETKSLHGTDLFEYIPEELHKSFIDVIRLVNENKLARTEIEYHLCAGFKKYLELNCSYLDFKGELAIMVIFRDFTERKHNETKILNAVIHAEEQERSRLAKDLHDGLGPIMATLKMYLEWLNDQEKISEHPDILQLALTSTEEAIIALKNVSNNLSPHVLEKFGIVAALNSYLDRVKKVSSITFNLSVTLAERLPLTVEMSVYRIITECITNSIRHSGATEIHLSLNRSNNSLLYQYRDNGKGFVMNEQESKHTGLGLANMKNRIKTLGGKINIKSEPGSGILILFDVPIN